MKSLFPLLLIPILLISCGNIEIKKTIDPKVVDFEAQYNADYQRDQAKIRDLERSPKAMEKIARERYFMKADDEDIFVLSDDDLTSKQTAGNEKAE